MKSDTRTKLEISLNIAAYAKVFAKKHDQDERIIREAMMIGAEIAIEETVNGSRDERAVEEICSAVNNKEVKVLQFKRK